MGDTRNVICDFSENEPFGINISASYYRFFSPIDSFVFFADTNSYECFYYL